MANFNQIETVQSAEVVTQINGLGSQMGVDLIVKAPSGKTITVNAGATIELEWTDTTGTKKLAQTLTSGSIDDTIGKNLGTYYPEGVVFENQAAVDSFFTGKITTKIFNATIPA
ncbi:MAG: hypothetical protein ACRC30_05010 [Clostridium sp.]